MSPKVLTQGRKKQKEIPAVSVLQVHIPKRNLCDFMLCVLQIENLKFLSSKPPLVKSSILLTRGGLLWVLFCSAMAFIEVKSYKYM